MIVGLARSGYRQFVVQEASDSPGGGPDIRVSAPKMTKDPTVESVRGLGAASKQSLDLPDFCDARERTSIRCTSHRRSSKAQRLGTQEESLRIDYICGWSIFR